MKATIVTCFESNEERVALLKNLLEDKNYDVSVITSDFSHIRKTKRINIPMDYYAIDTRPYSSNLSISRLISHSEFAKDAFKKVWLLKPDLLWVVVPCLSLIKEANNYKKKNPNVKIIVDVIDMWPESLPLGFIKRTFPFEIWKNIRTDNIGCADEVVTECNYYHNILKNEYNGLLTTIYWARGDKTKEYGINTNDDKLLLCYIGSINNIIDIDMMKEIIKKIDKKVILNIIGVGENKENMINILKEVCEVNYYGPIYDENKKQRIFSECHAGLNIYKKDLYIGLTVKCIDYFRYGLPIINNIKADTWSFVENNNVGINVNKDTIINTKELIDMRNNNQNIFDLYNNNFTKEVFNKKCLEVINRVMNK